MNVYLDLVVLLNFLVDFLLLLGTNRLSGFPPGIKRSLIAALVGGIYGGACVLTDFRFLGNPYWRFICLGAIALIAFGWNKSAVKRGGVFVLLSMALGGFASGLHESSFLMLVVSAVLMWGLCRISFGGRIGGRQYIPVEIVLQNETLRLTALCDTGNMLRDPLTGEQILVVDKQIAQRLTGLNTSQLKNPMETMLSGVEKGMRLIPYRAVGQPGSMLLGKRFQEVKIGSLRRSAVIAFAPELMDRGNMYQALTGGSV